MFAGSSTVLAGNATFTSATRISNVDDRVAGTIIASHAGTLHIEQSPDGTNWDLDKSIAVVGATGQGFSEELVAPYWRLRYVNGGTLQTSFRLAARTTSAGA